MNRANPLVRAIALGSLAAAACIAAIYLSGRLPGLTNGSSSAAATVTFAAMMFASTWALAALAAGTAGLAWHAIAVRRGWTHWFAYTLAGVTLGAALPASLTSPIWIAEIVNPAFELWGRAFSLIVTIVGAFVGLLTALFAWLIRRPDRDAPNPHTSPP
jgi:hypothetical protein